MQNITIAGANYQDVPSIEIPKQGGGIANFVDVSNTTATVNDVQNGVVFYDGNGNQQTGTYQWNYCGEGVEVLNGNIHYFKDYFKNTDYNTWTPSTTAAIIVASENKTAFAIDTGNYEYLIRWKFLAEWHWLTGVTMKATPVKQAIELWQAIFKRPSTYTNLQTPTFTANSCVTQNTIPIIDYYNTSGTHTMTFTGSYGVYPSAVAATFSNSTSNTPNLTVKTPSISARCNSSYFATARGDYVDKDTSWVEMKGIVYRMEKGAVMRSMYDECVNLYNNGM